jgi:hypothetical protein
VAVPAKAPRPVQVPSNLHGFEVVRQEYIAEYDAAAVLYRHKKTGAEARPNRCPRPSLIRAAF